MAALGGGGDNQRNTVFASEEGGGGNFNLNLQVITQGKLLITGLLNTSVGRIVTLTQWMLIGAVTVSVFGFIQSSSEVDAAMSPLHYHPPRWTPPPWEGPGPQGSTYGGGSDFGSDFDLGGLKCI